MTDKKIKNKPSDNDLFREAVSGVRPLKRDDKVTASSEKKTIKIDRTKHDQNSFSYALSDHFEQSLASTADQQLSYRGTGVQQRFFKKLRNGQIPLEARLDLHGHRVDSARKILSQFVFDCLELQYRCVIIVHGKGSRGDKPILKPLLNNWLIQIPDVLAFCSAMAKDGGTGAVYVLLKNTQKK